MTTGGGINTVKRDGQVVHITDLDSQALCTEWAKLKREVNELYEINRRANAGWRGAILSLLRIRLPDRSVITLGGVNERNQPIYPE